MVLSVVTTSRGTARVIQRINGGIQAGMTPKEAGWRVVGEVGLDDVTWNVAELLRREESGRLYEIGGPEMDRFEPPGTCESFDEELVSLCWCFFDGGYYGGDYLNYGKEGLERLYERYGSLFADEIYEEVVEGGREAADREAVQEVPEQPVADQPPDLWERARPRELPVGPELLAVLDSWVRQKGAVGGSWSFGEIGFLGGVVSGRGRELIEYLRSQDSVPARRVLGKLREVYDAISDRPISAPPPAGQLHNALRRVKAELRSGGIEDV